MRAGLSSSEGRDTADGVRQERTRLLESSLAKARGRIARRIRALTSDLARIAEAETLSLRAQLFVADAVRAPRGTSRLTAVDWSSGEAVPVTLDVNPALTPKEQLDAIFHRARRLKNGARIAGERLRDAERAVCALDALVSRLRDEDEVDPDELAAQARDVAPRDFLPPPRKPAEGRKTLEGTSLPYRTFMGTASIPIWVGRGAAQNDELTLHVAKPHHLWLHAKGQAGAHVVVPLAKGTSCPAELLVDAAHLAAYFSKAREESIVEVAYVPRRYVRKPRGSPPGLVVLAREKVLILRKSDAHLRRLLDRELASPT